MQGTVLASGIPESNVHEVDHQVPAPRSSP